MCGNDSSCAGGRREPQQHALPDPRCAGDRGRRARLSALSGPPSAPRHADQYRPRRTVDPREIDLQIARRQNASAATHLFARRIGENRLPQSVIAPAAGTAPRLRRFIYAISPEEFHHDPARSGTAGKAIAWTDDGFAERRRIDAGGARGIFCRHYARRFSLRFYIRAGANPDRVKRRASHGSAAHRAAYQAAIKKTARYSSGSVVKNSG